MVGTDVIGAVVAVTAVGSRIATVVSVAERLPRPVTEPITVFPAVGRTVESSLISGLANPVDLGALSDQG